VHVIANRECAGGQDVSWAPPTGKRSRCSSPHHPTRENISRTLTFRARSPFAHAHLAFYPLSPRERAGVRVLCPRDRIVAPRHVQAPTHPLTPSLIGRGRSRAQGHTHQS